MLKELKKINADDEMRAFLEDCEKARRDELSARNAARLEGLEEGLEEGFEKGRLFLIRKLLSAGVDAAQIAQSLSLPVAEIEKLRGGEDGNPVKL
jgi:predicted transposase/invertase (TIGR01784 family)